MLSSHIPMICYFNALEDFGIWCMTNSHKYSFYWHFCCLIGFVVENFHFLNFSLSCYFSNLGVQQKTNFFICFTSISHYLRSFEFTSSMHDSHVCCKFGQIICLFHSRVFSTHY